MDLINDHILREARDSFERLLCEKTTEQQWQSFFSNHPYIFSLSLPFRLMPNDIIPLGRPGKSEPDFIFYPHRHSPVPYYGVIEIKKPDTKIVTVSRANVAVLSRDAATAVNQAQAYSELVKTSFIKCIDEFLCLGNKSHLFIIMGMTKELSLKLGNESLFEMVQNNIPKNMQIIPYDELLRRFESELPPKISILYPRDLYDERRRNIFAFAETLKNKSVDIKPENVFNEIEQLTESMYKVFELSKERYDALAVFLPKPDNPETITCVAEVGFGQTAKHMKYKIGNSEGLTGGIIDRREPDYCIDHLATGSRSIRGIQTSNQCEKKSLSPLPEHCLSFVGVPLGRGNAYYNKGAIVFNISTPFGSIKGDRIAYDYVEPLSEIADAMNPIIEGPWKKLTSSV